jgi:uncharacterized damage-inducible protein DinB
MDEYGRAMRELSRLVGRLSDADYERPRDPSAADASCHSIQTVLTHVVSAGYGYAGMLRAAWDLPPRVHDRRDVPRTEALERLTAVLEHTAATLEGRWDLTEADQTAVQMRSRWGTVYDFEQLFEHAIVHVLRHRRQIEAWLARPE